MEIEIRNRLNYHRAHDDFGMRMLDRFQYGGMFGMNVQVVNVVDERTEVNAEGQRVVRGGAGVVFCGRANFGND